MTALTGMDTSAKVRGVQYKNRFYGWNGRNRPRVFDGVGWTKCGIDRDSSTPSVSAIAGSLTGTYRYFFVPVNSKKVMPFGYVVSAIPSHISAEITVSGQGVRVGSLPASHSDSQVDKVYIYRNRSGEYTTSVEVEMQPFYYVGSVNIGTTTFDDTATTDDLLTGINPIRFNCNIPPTFKYGAIYGERLFGMGFDPITTGTVSASGTALTFGGGASLPDGVVGCWFQADNDNVRYRITARGSTTSATIDSSYVGTLSNGTYRIYRDPWEVYFSENGNFEAWGPNGEGYRWTRELPGQDHGTGLIQFNGMLLVFSATAIYAVTGKGAPDDIRITPDPIYRGLGAVSGDAIWRQGDNVYFLSLQGPAVLKPGQPPQLIGRNLNTDWLDALTAAEQGVAVVYGEADWIEFWVPRSGETENSRGFRFMLSDESWWEVSGAHPSFGFSDDGDDGLQGKAFFGQDRFIYQPYVGVTDMVPTSGTIYKGTATSNANGATTLTDSGASFPTTDGGLEQCYVRFYLGDEDDENEEYLGARRIISNTGTTITWASGTGTGNGTLDITTATRYEIGVIEWKWTTKLHQQPGHMKVDRALSMGFDEIGSPPNQLVRMTQYSDGISASYEDLIWNSEFNKLQITRMRNQQWQGVFRSRGNSATRYGALLRYIMLETDVQEGNT